MHTSTIYLGRVAFVYTKIYLYDAIPGEHIELYQTVSNG